MNIPHTLMPHWQEAERIDLSKGIHAQRLRRYTTVLREVFDYTGDCVAAYRQTCYYQRLAFWQQSQPYDWKFLSHSATLSKAISTEPSVILLAHTYSYRLVIQYLLTKGVKIALFVSSDVLIDQGNLLLDIAARYAHPASDQFRLLHAQDPHVLLKARRAHAEGYHLVAYIDGNTGSSSTTRQTRADNRQQILFGSTQIRVRAGIIRIAQWLNCALYSIWTAMDKEHMPVFMHQEWDQTLDEAQLMQAIFDNLYGHIKKDPPQWECLLYFEEFLQ